jgi:predicted unusual protein kinase regulating ubiquinone biosynthesis (AarF/ABC1/UbiB family)
VPSFDTKVAMLLLEAELGGPWTDFYSELTPKPIAAASLGQVGADISMARVHASLQQVVAWRQFIS